VILDCGTSQPRLLRVRDPFGKLVVKAMGGVRIDGAAIFGAAWEERTMNTAESTEVIDVLERVRTWSPPQRITLARRILETLETPGSEPPIEAPTRGWPVERALGLLKSDRKPPDDEECRRIVEEERWQKYGS
jgi:hypothetical protein